MDGKILIVDDVATNRIVFKVKLGAAHYLPLLASNGTDGLRMARSERPDLILLDLMLPDLPGVEVLRRLRDDPVTRDIPVVVVSTSTRLEDRLAALEAGADDMFGKPLDDALLLARVRNLLRNRQDLADLTDGHAPLMLGIAEAGADFTHPGVLAVVTDRPDMALRLRRDLAGLIRDRIVVLGQADTLEDAGPGRAAADVYVIDATGAQLDRALRLVSDLRSRTATRHAGICLMTGNRMPPDMLMAYDVGANALFSADMPMAEVAMRLRGVMRGKRRADARREQVQDGLRLAMVDPLTGLFNRRYATARLTMMADHACATRTGFAVMIVDIDRFKSVNDRFGHAAGDHVLREIGNILTANLRNEDLLARIGGEEFLIALPDTGLEEAQAIGSRLCRQIEARPILLADGQGLTITVSVGVALTDDLTGQAGRAVRGMIGTVIDRADRALMQSKQAGRNQVTLSFSPA